MLSKIRKAIDSVELAFFALCLSALVALTVTAVIMRYVVGKPFGWTEEVQMLLLVWSVFSGASIAFRERGHIAIDLLTNALPKKVQEVIEVIVWILVMISICMIFKLELDRTMKFLATGQSTTMLKIPKFYIYGVVVVCCAMMVVNHVLNGIEDIKKFFRKGDSAK
jgi:C4-dicarboxylate transporter, small subunit|uniref:TRAP transporter small permease n=1 Tax=Candidatus Limivicinus sp. TaxID=3030905 RepID=UPI003FF03EBF